MDILLWLGWSVAIVVTVFTVWMLAAGAYAARSPSWELELYQAAHEELEARRLIGQDLFLEERELARRVLGTEPPPVDEDADARLLGALQALTGATGQDLVRLRTLRRGLLHEAVTAQHRTVEDVTAPWVFEKLWRLRRHLSVVRVAARGLRWFAPLFATRAREIGERHLSTATLLGVWFGFLFWGSRQMVGRGPSDDWTSIVGVVVTVACAIGLAATAAHLMSAVAVAWWGPPRTWTRKGVGLSIISGATVSLLLALTMTGTLQRASLALNQWSMTRLEELDLSEKLGGVLVLASILYLIRNAIGLVRSRALRATDRISICAAGVMLLAFAVVILAFFLGAEPRWMNLSMYASAAMMCAAGIAGACVAGIRWVGDYRYLRMNGVTVERRGFSPWAIPAWIVAVIVVTIVTAAMRSAGSVSSSPVLQLMSILLVGLELILVVMVFPGLMVCALYVRRVSKTATAARHRRQAPIMTTVREDDCAREVVARRLGAHG